MRFTVKLASRPAVRYHCNTERKWYEHQEAVCKREISANHNVPKISNRSSHEERSSLTDTLGSLAEACRSERLGCRFDVGNENHFGGPVTGNLARSLFEVRHVSLYS
ncbi:hypothetical protein [Dactylosporangium sp. NPDC049140]|uniref:hypothetical protein n=1 Tax=Dactylosporangium sp. NPDC049140 TaxID=3155647 RepID=UPI0033F4878E